MLEGETRLKSSEMTNDAIISSVDKSGIPVVKAYKRTESQEGEQKIVIALQYNVFMM